jgi:hypothetical protein
MPSKKFNTYILKYPEVIPLDDIAQLKAKVEDLNMDCELQNIGSDNKVYYLCQDVLAAFTKEGAMVSAEANYPHIPKNKLLIFDRKGKRLKI